MKQSSINLLKEEIGQFNHVMDVRMKELERKLNEKIDSRLDEIYDNFENLPEAQKQYFLGRLKGMRE